MIILPVIKPNFNISSLLIDVLLMLQYNYYVGPTSRGSPLILGAKWGIKKEEREGECVNQTHLLSLTLCAGVTDSLI